MKPILECRDLSKTFTGPQRLFKRNRGVTAVDRVSLRVMPGEPSASGGESGSGQSTLVRLLLRMLAASAGAEGPGPIITTMAKTVGSCPMPVTVVPGNLTDEDIDALS